MSANNMKYLMEHETAFDSTTLGFPSIQGCHAIVYQTKSGIYGFHVAGGSGNNRWPYNARHFAQFIRQHGGGIAKGSRLYGVTYIGNNQRGYSAPARTNWKNELVEFATALSYTGKISGYDLDKTLAQGTSAYVEYRVNGDKCDVFIETWTGPHTPDRTANTNRQDHKGKAGTMDNPSLIDLDTVVSNVTKSALVKISKDKLR